MEEVLDEIGAARAPARCWCSTRSTWWTPRAARRSPTATPTPSWSRPLTGEGLDQLRNRLAEAARARLTPLDLTIPYAQAGLIATVYADGREIVQESTEEGTRVRALMPPAAAARLRAALNGSDGLGRPS